MNKSESSLASYYGRTTPSGPIESLTERSKRERKEEETKTRDASEKQRRQEAEEQARQARQKIDLRARQAAQFAAEENVRFTREGKRRELEESRVKITDALSEIGTSMQAKLEAEEQSRQEVEEQVKQEAKKQEAKKQKRIDFVKDKLGLYTSGNIKNRKDDELIKFKRFVEDMEVSLKESLEVGVYDALIKNINKEIIRRNREDRKYKMEKFKGEAERIRKDIQTALYDSTNEDEEISTLAKSQLEDYKLKANELIEEINNEENLSQDDKTRLITILNTNIPFEEPSYLLF